MSRQNSHRTRKISKRMLIRILIQVRFGSKGDDVGTPLNVRFSPVCVFQQCREDFPQFHTPTWMASTSGLRRLHVESEILRDQNFTRLHATARAPTGVPADIEHSQCVAVS